MSTKPALCLILWLLLAMLLATAAKPPESQKPLPRKLTSLKNLTNVELAPSFNVELACGTSIYSGSIDDDGEYGDSTRKVADVVGGQEARPGEFPWLAKLSDKGQATPYCGGSILNSYHILTAAHCVHNCTTNVTTEAKDLSVRVGAHDRIEEALSTSTSTSQEHDVEQVIIHHGYCSKHLRNGNDDLALLKLTKPISFGLLEEGYGSVNTICLPEAQPSTELEDGSEMKMAGWGFTRHKPSRVSPHKLQTLKLAYVEGDRCQSMFETIKLKVNFDRLKEVCAGGRNNEGACQGDSGGPLMRDLGGGVMELVGVVSRVQPCGHQDSPAVFARPDVYLEWIAENTSLDNDNN